MENLENEMNEEVNDGDLDKELNSYDIAKLRKYAGLQRVAISRDMNKAAIIAAIKNKLKDRDAVFLADVGSAPRPGWARIILHRDGTPGAENRPVYVHVNGYKCTIPKGVEVDVPIKVVNVLNDAKEIRKVEDPSEPYNSPSRWKNTAVHSYPFQTIQVTPGPDPKPGLERTKASSYGPRKAFCDKFGRWPKRYELMEAIKDGLIKIDSGQKVDAKEFE